MFIAGTPRRHSPTASLPRGRRCPMRSIATLLLAALLTACAVGPDYRRPALKTGAEFVNAKAVTYSDQYPIAHFWTEFGDETLDHLVGDALLENHDLRIALAHVREARALHRETRLDLAPTVTASGAYTKERFSQEQSAAAFGRDQTQYQAGFDASWELDLFGRVRRGVEASHAEMQGAEAGLRDAQVIVTAEVARTYFELRGLQTQLAVARRNVDNQQETLQLTTVRLDAGRGTELDTTRAQAQLSATLATVGPLDATGTFVGGFHPGPLPRRIRGCAREKRRPPGPLPAGGFPRARGPGGPFRHQGRPPRGARRCGGGGGGEPHRRTTCATALSER